MHLLVFPGDFYPTVSGGAHEQWRFCEVAAKQGHQISVITPRVDNTSREETVNGVRILRPIRTKPERLPAYAPTAIITRIVASVFMFGYGLWWFRNKNVDGIYSSSYSTHWIAKILSMLYRVPYVNHIAYTPTARRPWKPSPTFVLERVNFKLFLGKHVFCRVPRVRDVIAKMTNAKVEIIHGILNKKRVTQAAESADPVYHFQTLDIGSDEQLLLFVGRLSPNKNPVSAVETIDDLGSNYKLVMIGDGPERERVKDKVDQLALNDRVELLGERSHQETLEWMMSADALLLTSYVEAYPTVVFEALVLGTHVFATPVGILPHIDNLRLTVAESDEHSELVRQTTLTRDYSIDDAVLDNYSMQQYTSTILEAFKQEYQTSI